MKEQCVKLGKCEFGGVDVYGDERRKLRRDFSCNSGNSGGGK